MRILITGATGLVGQKLGQELVRLGHQIIVISRNAKKAKLVLPFPCEVIEGDLSKVAVEDSRLSNIEGVVHLMGENVGTGRWTEDRKKKIQDSRILSTQNLHQTLSRAGGLKVFVCASATGIYKQNAEPAWDEQGSHGEGFLAQVCEQWESEAQRSQASRIVILRQGVILSSEGGALEKMREPFRSGLAGVLGSGEQWMSWIHVQDVVRLFVRAINDEKMIGVYNAVAPNPVSNREFSKSLALALTGSPSLGVPVPAFALKLAFGEMSEVILGSQNIRCRRLIDEKFEFLYPTLESALTECCAYYPEGYSLLRAEQFLDVPRDRVFEFFAEALNLEKITPSFLNFKIKNVSTPQIQNGTLIEYTLKVHQVPIFWRTEISDWTPGFKFTDSQLKGPYNKWIHTHTFEDLGSGTLMKDIVRYKLPLGGLGHTVAGAFVRSDVEQIFSYRRTSVLEFLK